MSSRLVPAWVNGVVRFLDLWGVSLFYRLEATMWRKLFEEQRGGDAYESLQVELCKVRSENERLKREIVALTPNSA